MKLKNRFKNRFVMKLTKIGNSYRYDMDALNFRISIMQKVNEIRNKERNEILKSLN